MDALLDGEYYLFYIGGVINEWRRWIDAHLQRLSEWVPDFRVASCRSILKAEISY